MEVISILNLVFSETKKKQKQQQQLVIQPAYSHVMNSNSM